MKRIGTALTACMIVIASAIALAPATTALPAAASKGYARLTVPAQVVTGYFDAGTGIGKLAPYGLIAYGGTVQDHYTWAKVSTSPAFMPDLAINPRTGVVTGAGPTIAQGKHQLAATVTDAKGRRVSFTVGIEIIHCDSAAGIAQFQTCPEISYTEYNANRTAYIPAGKRGYDYATTLSITAGIPPYSFVRSDGVLPPGITLHRDTGVLSGIPTQVGQSGFRITVIDSAGHTVRMDASILVKP